MGQTFQLYLSLVRLVDACKDDAVVGDQVVGAMVAAERVIRKYRDGHIGVEEIESMFDDEGNPR